MNEQHTPNLAGQASVSSGAPHRGRKWAVAGLATLLFGAISVTGLSFAHDGQHRGHGRGYGMGMHGQMDPAKAAERIDRMLARLVPDATAEQKTRIKAIATAALADLRPLKDKHRADRARAVQLLTQQNVDRAAIEQLRVAEMQSAEQVSKRMTQALADAAEVLTPAQRAKVAEHFSKRMERMR